MVPLAKAFKHQKTSLGLERLRYFFSQFVKELLNTYRMQQMHRVIFNKRVIILQDILFVKWMILEGLVESSNCFELSMLNWFWNWQRATLTIRPHRPVMNTHENHWGKVAIGQTVVWKRYSPVDKLLKHQSLLLWGNNAANEPFSFVWWSYRLKYSTDGLLAQLCKC